MRRLDAQVLLHLRSNPSQPIRPSRPLFLAASAIAVVFFCMGLAAPHSALAFWSKYRLFQCNSSYEAYKCQTCQQLPALRLGFEVDPARQLVALTVFEHGRAGTNQILLDCSVNSKESWGCGKKSTRKSGRLVASTSYSMTNGLFTAENASFSGQSAQTGFYCGKP